MNRSQFYQTIFIYIVVLICFVAILVCIQIFFDDFSSKKKTDAELEENKSNNPVITIVPDDTPPQKKRKKKQLNTVFEATGAVIWPLKDLDMYESPDAGSEKLAKCTAGEHLYVLEENDIYFKVIHDEQEGYIDGRYCMINLPDYFGNAVEFDITNSYSSIFMAHEYGLPGITDTIIPGYEDIYRDNDECEFYVPYLYPCAKRLERVVEKVNADGLRLKIYDAFRPHEATRFLYDTVSGMLDTDVSSEGAHDSLSLTYGKVITGNSYKLGAFLAREASAHNRGIALDLTLYDPVSGEDLEMQSAMHDLSYHSVLNKNNENADRLAEYMKSEGFNDLVSEWWHFQDDETRNALQINFLLEKGVG